MFGMYGLLVLFCDLRQINLESVMLPATFGLAVCSLDSSRFPETPKEHP